MTKLFKKDPKTRERIIKKIQEVINSNPEHYKNLRYDLKEFKRVQIGHFILVFKFDKSENKICFVDFVHHDKAYKKKF